MWVPGRTKAWLYNVTQSLFDWYCFREWHRRHQQDGNVTHRKGKETTVALSCLRRKQQWNLRMKLPRAGCTRKDVGHQLFFSFPMILEEALPLSFICWQHVIRIVSSYWVSLASASSIWLSLWCHQTLDLGVLTAGTPVPQDATSPMNISPPRILTQSMGKWSVIYDKLSSAIKLETWREKLCLRNQRGAYRPWQWTFDSFRVAHSITACWCSCNDLDSGLLTGERLLWHLSTSFLTRTASSMFIPGDVHNR